MILVGATKANGISAWAKSCYLVFKHQRINDNLKPTYGDTEIGDIANSGEVKVLRSQQGAPPEGQFHCAPLPLVS
jgi:hypothetical protein